MSNKIKKNILVLATHSSYYIPRFLKIFLTSDMKKNNSRLVKNFSDFWTKYLVKDLENVITFNFSRAIWDPNRDLNASDLFKDTDFGLIKV